MTELTAEQWKTIEDGIAFYKAAAPVIKAGRSYRFGPEILSYNEPEGWQGIFAGWKSGRKPAGNPYVWRRVAGMRKPPASEEYKNRGSVRL